MTENTTFFAVNYLTAVSVSGDDAATFLQGQLTADVCALATGEWCRTAYCSPKGRVVATMIFARRDEGYVALLASDLVDELITRLSRFVMRSKVKITRLAAAVDASLPLVQWGRAVYPGFHCPGWGFGTASTKNPSASSVMTDRRPPAERRLLTAVSNTSFIEKWQPDTRSPQVSAYMPADRPVTWRSSACRHRA